MDLKSVSKALSFQEKAAPLDKIVSSSSFVWLILKDYLNKWELKLIPRAFTFNIMNQSPQSIISLYALTSTKCKKTQLVQMENGSAKRTFQIKFT